MHLSMQRLHSLSRTAALGSLHKIKLEVIPVQSIHHCTGPAILQSEVVGTEMACSRQACAAPVSTELYRALREPRRCILQRPAAEQHLDCLIGMEGGGGGHCFGVDMPQDERCALPCGCWRLLMSASAYATSNNARRTYLPGQLALHNAFDRTLHSRLPP